MSCSQLSTVIRTSSAKTGGTTMVRQAWRLVVVGLLLCAGTFSACGSAASGGTITLTVSTNQVGDQAKGLHQIAPKFMQQNPNIKLRSSPPRPEHKHIIKLNI